MSKATDEEDATRRLASSPCGLEGLRPDGSVIADAEQARDVARWRKAERERLIQERCLLPVSYRTDRTAVIGRQLDRLVAESGVVSPTVSVYWPIRGEPDLRPWMRTLIPLGASVALPIALALGEPLVFRRWHPECRMEGASGTSLILRMETSSCRRSSLRRWWALTVKAIGWATAAASSIAPLRP